MAGSPAISIITPSYKRERLLQLQHQTVLRQTEQDFEWLILDDSPEPSSYFSELNDVRIRYTHCAGKRLRIGEKRNWLVERARSEFIAHFDDDDFYARDYVHTMRQRLLRRIARRHRAMRSSARCSRSTSARSRYRPPFTNCGAGRRR